jgi:hypothetical protein
MKFHSGIAGLLFLHSFSSPFALAQDDGYIGYSLKSRGDPDSVIYDTASTHANSSTTVPEPDVFLNATVHVSEIDLLVSNLTAKINLDAQVLSLLDFNAGVTASIDRVSLLIKDVDAHVTLEARLANLLTMISNVLDSIDLNPVIATLSSGLEEVVGDLGDTLGADETTASGLNARDLELAQNILYSVNDYTGNKHTNRVLEQNGDLVDHRLNNNGVVLSEKKVGNYATDMHFTGHNVTVTRGGEERRELEYRYHPFPGLTVISLIYTTLEGQVVSTQVLSEGFAGGSSTVGEKIVS